LGRQRIEIPSMLSLILSKRVWGSWYPLSTEP